ncbi:MAG: squalene/phytoene synthase family protein [Alphaproteobacteria bacterium]|nr:squalene/phytoene synthase family protein [Alphaproteobacteria bacterium]
MSIDACAEKVRRGDPDRFATALIAPPEMRSRLMVLYAFNLEIARAPWVTNEPMIAEMRLQFWADVIDEIADGKPTRSHEVAGPLADLVQAAVLPVADLHAMVQARRFDIYREPFQDAAALVTYTRASAGSLMWLAARALGADRNCRDLVADFGGATGVAGLLRANAELARRGHVVLPDQTHPAIAQLANGALKSLRHARLDRRRVPKSTLAALLAGWQADGILKRARNSPQVVLDGTLEASEFAKRSGLVWRSVVGRW